MQRSAKSTLDVIGATVFITFCALFMLGTFLCVAVSLSLERMYCRVHGHPASERGFCTRCGSTYC